MAARDSTPSTTIDPGTISRVLAGASTPQVSSIRYQISGVGPANWFGPNQPLAPQAQDRVEGRQFDYPVGYNLRLTPRQEESISFAQLRALADNYDLMRLVIEKRKDQIEAFDWEILPRDDEAGADDFKSQIREVTDFLETPDGQLMWQQWLRQAIEEVLVIDALCIYPRANRGGGLYGLELVDGATIKPLIDVTGRTPLPPDPAYQQVLKGIPAADYTLDELLYFKRNPRVWKVYGFSPVEQVITTVNIALRRQISQLSFYTEGNVPEALVQVPDSWTPKQITDFQNRFDDLLAGNLGERRKMKFIPSVGGIDYPKSGLIKDEMDEWLARIVCFCFSISPSALIKQVNRASGEQMADTAKEEGLMPLLRFIEGVMSRVIQRTLGRKDLRFAFKIINRVAPLEQAQIDKIYLDAEVVTPDEVRQQTLGMQPMTEEERAEAFPTPIPPGFNPDGTPLLPKGAPGAAAGGPEGAGAPVDGGSGAVPPPAKGGKDGSATGETPAEKMLGEALRMLDPERLAKVLADAARAQAPRIVEVKPEVNVDVGDVVVHTPVGRRGE